MKSIKLLTATLALSLIAVIAQAQVTPEAIMGQCPPWPSIQALVRYGAHGIDKSPSVKQFIDMCEKASQQIDEKLSKQMNLLNENQALAQADAALAAQGMNRNTSEAEARNKGETQANKLLGKLGIKKNSSEMQNMSEAEKKQTGEDVAQRMTGMSIAQLQALENMSEAEQLAYMQQNGQMGKVANASTGRGQAAVNTRSIVRMNELAPKMTEAATRIRTVENEILTAQNQLHEQARELWERKYAEQDKELRKEISKWDIHEGASAETDARLAAAVAAHEKWREQYYGEIVTPWVEMCGKHRDKAKTLLSDARIIDEYNALVVKTSGLQTAGISSNEREIYVARMVFGAGAAVTGFYQHQR